jgi:3-oxoacyl-[acyl-carrier protein] reductase
MNLGLAGRVYIVTAATRGLGFASARELVTDGAHIVVTGRTKESVAEAVDALGGPEIAEGVVADNAAEDTAERVVGAALARFGRLDGVLISVGGPAAGTALATPESAWREGFESVFLGALRIARAASDVLQEGGAIGFVLSSSVKEPIPGLAVSNGLRPGLAMAAKTLANELGPEGIRVFGLLPARIETERVAHLDALTPDPSATRAAYEASIPLRRYGRPEEFGKVAAFALSPAASYLTGVMIPVDGGAMEGI